VLLRAAGCQSLQGWLFGRPQPIGALAERLATVEAVRA